MEYPFLVETCLLTHGLATITDAEMQRSLEGIPAGYPWIEKGELHIEGLEAFMAFRRSREGNRASDKNLDDYLGSEKSAALTASATMEICRRKGIPLAVSCGIGGISDIPGLEFSSDLTALETSGAPLLATAPKDMMDIPTTIAWLREHGVRTLGAGSDRCTGWVFHSADAPLDGILEEGDALQGPLLLLQPIPEEARIADPGILQEALRIGAQAAAEGRALHPAINTALHHLTEGRTARLQLQAVAENLRLAERLLKEQA